MDNRDLDTDDAWMSSALAGGDDIHAVVAFYERTGAMPVSSIGPPIDRPIIPSRRPDNVADFNFTVESSLVAPTRSGTVDAEDPEAEKIRQAFVDMLRQELKGQ